MASVDQGEFPPAFKRVHGYVMFGMALVTVVFGWGATWTNTQNHIAEVKSDVARLSEQDERQQRALNSNQESLARIETSVQWIKEALASSRKRDQ